ncbi:hypothetical protein [Rhodococcus chondri]|uniref:Uncharacterized protein n=1 Tax=Rhodococcus chondri TaxID=3065941 RepID=A0ABU7JUX0_9NOCA|nr:hypothetical protein [Rhodococcus sp. CC-R104]MEE2033714.1 hypothetical protein [Rhodococcus sp. CC-R104]
MGALHRRWWHSFEEDHDGIEVYRPDGFDFPPARGRGGIEFRDDGTAVEWTSGRADAPEAYEGTWQPEADGESLEVATTGGRPRSVRVVHVDAHRLEIRTGQRP